jgi:type IV secretory pathway protease TraF
MFRSFGPPDARGAARRLSGDLSLTFCVACDRGRQKRRRNMKRLAIAALAAAGLASAAPAQEAPETLVTILTAPEPQTQLMAMVLAMQAAQQGVAPHILLCGPAGDLALKDAPETATAPQPPRGMSPQGLMRQIAALPDARVEVCAIYLPGKEADASVLLDGITIAKPPEMAAAMIAPNARIASY